MKKSILFHICILFLTTLSFSQTRVGVGTTTPDTIAALDIQQGSSPQGMYIPRLRANKRLAISTPNTGLLVYDLDSLCIFHWNGTLWKSLCSSASGVAPVKKPQKKYYSIPPVEFDAFDTQNQFAQKPKSINGNLVSITASNSTPGFAIAPVFLPQGAIIDSLYAYLSDNENSSGEIELYKVDLFNPSAFPLTAEILIGEIITNTKSTTRVKYGVKITSNNVIENKQFAYYVVYKQRTNDAIKNYGVTIAYTVQGY
jgi:hypothetical protein